MFPSRLSALVLSATGKIITNKAKIAAPFRIDKTPMSIVFSLPFQRSLALAWAKKKPV